MKNSVFTTEYNTNIGRKDDSTEALNPEYVKDAQGRFLVTAIIQFTDDKGVRRTEIIPYMSDKVIGYQNMAHHIYWEQEKFYDRYDANILAIFPGHLVDNYDLEYQLQKTHEKQKRAEARAKKKAKKEIK